MATRFYFQSSGAVDISPTVDTAGWFTVANATGFIRRPMNISKQSTAMTTTNFTGVSTTADWKCGMQFICNTQLAAQTLNGTWKSNWRYKVNATGATAAHSTGNLRVMNSTGATERGHEGNDDASNATTTLSSRAIAAVTVSPSISVSDNDYLVFEIGEKTGSGESNFDISYGDDSATDLAADTDGTTTADNPWLEYSGTILFMASATSNQLMMVGVGI